MADVKQAGVGGFGDLGTHGLDILMWWMGDQPVEKTTASLAKGSARYPACDELGAQVAYRFPDGRILRFHGRCHGIWESECLRGPGSG